MNLLSLQRIRTSTRSPRSRTPRSRPATYRVANTILGRWPVQTNHMEVCHTTRRATLPSSETTTVSVNRTAASPTCTPASPRTTAPLTTPSPATRLMTTAPTATINPYCVKLMWQLIRTRQPQPTENQTPDKMCESLTSSPAPPPDQDHLKLSPTWSKLSLRPSTPTCRRRRSPPLSAKRSYTH